MAIRPQISAQKSAHVLMRLPWLNIEDLTELERTARELTMDVERAVTAAWLSSRAAPRSRAGGWRDRGR